ncbi:MAG: hypothetical protein HZA63_02255 [Rhodocyclales bacterium]|nr:hypothetical protein [Rhodocyclales bacterium]
MGTVVAPKRFDSGITRNCLRRSQGSWVRQQRPFRDECTVRFDEYAFARKVRQERDQVFPIPARGKTRQDFIVGRAAVAETEQLAQQPIRRRDFDVAAVMADLRPVSPQQDVAGKIGMLHAGLVRCRSHAYRSRRLSSLY